MGMLDDILAGLSPGGPRNVTWRTGPVTGAIDSVTKEPLTEAEVAALARKARGRITDQDTDERISRAGIPVPDLAMSPAAPLSNAAPQIGLGLAQTQAPSVLGPGASQLPTGPPIDDPQAAAPQPFVNGVPMPRPRPTDMPGAPFSLAPQDTAAMPPGASPTVGAVPPAVPRPASTPPASDQQDGPLSGLLGKIFNPAHAATMMALASGFSGAPSFGTGMGRAFGAAVPAAAADRAYDQKQSGIAQTYKALVARGVPPQEALAASLNPDIMKATAAKYFETKPLTIHDTTNALGEKTPVVFNPNTGKFQDMSGNPLGSGSDGSNVSGPGGLGVGVLAPGVKYDPNLSGDAYMGQFSKEVQAAARAYINGDVLPAGNPRQNTIVNFAKTVAQRYGQDTSVPVSDALYSEKRKFFTELGSGTANSIGGQVKAFNQGIEHADKLADRLEKLGNWDPVGVPGVARAANWTREAMSTKQEDLAKGARVLGQTLAGEVGKLFSGSAGGGVHERELTRDRFSTVSSPRELAGALEGTIETMDGGLRALEQRRDQVLGPNNTVKFVTADTEAKIARIKDVIARLRSGDAPTATVPAATPPPVAPRKTSTGVTWSVQ